MGIMQFYIMPQCQLFIKFKTYSENVKFLKLAQNIKKNTNAFTIY